MPFSAVELLPRCTSAATPRETLVRRSDRPAESNQVSTSISGRIGQSPSSVIITKVMKQIAIMETDHLRRRFFFSTSHRHPAIIRVRSTRTQLLQIIRVRPTRTRPSRIPSTIAVKSTKFNQTRKFALTWTYRILAPSSS